MHLAGRSACFVAAIVTVLPVALLEGASQAQSVASTDSRAFTPGDAPPKIGSDWVRLRYDDQNTNVRDMQTAIVRYRPAGVAGRVSEDLRSRDVSVDLVAAVHVGDLAYYRDLNRRFAQYDAVLYELIAPEGTVVERGRGTSNAHPVGALQNGMKSMLALEHQLEQIDYTKKNFVHADMSPDQFMEAMKNRDEGFLEMYMRLLGHSIAMQSDKTAKGESPEMEMLAAFFSNDRPRRLKQALAKQLAESESMLVSFGGEEGSVLITDRNRAALKVLDEQLKAGKKRLAVFYGAGHLPDMDRRLREEFGLEPVEITWLTAWDLRAAN
jgi:hypothetical protein